ncbi:unnamed protein product [Oncorhynchus mykiss]|uniref:Uncharacterized protein n=1 Tax=Oncorhynchus mykiss TaxID=8022 RepID=A0A061A5T0_ONCMY|nr:unnamed protein product [Oncorhynchus mykiss]
MSLSLALSLPLSPSAVSDGSKKQKSAAKKKHTQSKVELMGLVSTNRQGVSRQVRRLQGRLGPGKSKATVKDKRIKSAVGEWLNAFRGTKYFCALCRKTNAFICVGDGLVHINIV